MKGTNIRHTFPKWMLEGAASPGGMTNRRVSQSTKGDDSMSHALIDGKEKSLNVVWLQCLQNCFVFAGLLLGSLSVCLSVALLKRERAASTRSITAATTFVTLTIPLYDVMFLCMWRILWGYRRGQRVLTGVWAGQFFMGLLIGDTVSWMIALYVLTGLPPPVRNVVVLVLHVLSIPFLRYFASQLAEVEDEDDEVGESAVVQMGDQVDNGGSSTPLLVSAIVV